MAYFTISSQLGGKVFICQVNKVSLPFNILSNISVIRLEICNQIDIGT